MAAIATAFFLAIAANRIVEAFVAPVRKRWPALDLWWLVYVTWIVGGVISYLAGINLFAELVPGLPPLAGQVLTALVVGGGSNLLHDLFDKPTTQVTTAASVPTTVVVKTEPPAVP